MKISVGSQNDTKINAVKEAVKNFPAVKDAEVVSVKIELEIYGHPKSLGETIDGAMDRASRAFQNCDYSVGIESGLMPMPKTKTGFMELAVCAIYDGTNYHLGTSPAFEWPKAVADGIINKGLDGSQAFKAAGLTDEEKIGSNMGAIHFLSKGALNRTDYNKWAVMMALVHIENPKLYE